LPGTPRLRHLLEVSSLKGLKYLKIRIGTSSKVARPKLAVWLDALSELLQLKALTLHYASPVAPPSPFEVERTLTLPSLTHLDISASAEDCALVLAHLDLPALTCLCLRTVSLSMSGVDMQNLLPYITRHAQGPQDAQPLQSVLIRSNERGLTILAWPVPDIDAEVHNPPALLGATLPTRVALSFELIFGLSSHVRFLDMVMAALPLDDLVMLAAQDVETANDLTRDLTRDLSTQQFWLRHATQWPLLQRVRVAPPVTLGFIQALLEDDGGREMPLLPSLTELVVYGSLHELSLLPLRATLMKRVKQGIPLDMLDLRTCHHDSHSFAGSSVVR
jgi:hypothetical protein